MKLNIRPLAIGIPILLAGVAALVAGCGGNGDATAQPVTAQQACDALTGKTIAGATVTAVAVAASGAVPTYCMASGKIAPSLNFQMRLPQTWNGKLHYGGGGGYNGVIPGLSGNNLAALNLGYATVSSDSGHQGGDVFSAAFALNDPVAAQLFGSLSVPTVMSSAQELLKTAYGTAPSRSYFEGCSNGGREALMNVQRYPNLFDGVIARAPAYNWVGVLGHDNRTAKALAAPGDPFPLVKIQLMAKAVRDACDGLDGIVDGVVSNQAACTPAVFNPATLRCAGGADTGNTCLSDAQLAVVTSWTTEAVFTASPGYRNAAWSLTGNEDSAGAWPLWVTGNGTLTTALQYRFQDTTVKNYLARDSSANSLNYSPWDQNPSAIFALAALNDATSVNIRPFRDSGAKLLLWHGANDSALSANATIEYFNKVKNEVGTASVDTFARLYIAPGVNHCSGGPGADSADLLSALDNWVVNNAAPGTLTAQKLIAATGAVDFSRPLCQYPLYPKYTGPANNMDAAKLATNYTCS